MRACMPMASASSRRRPATTGSRTRCRSRRGTRRRSTRCASCSGRRARSRSRCWARTPWTSAPTSTAPPLVTGDAVTDARTGVDQAGTPTLDLTFDATAAAALADATRTHVGEYLAIALDGVAITVPVINEEIPDGRSRSRFATDDTTAGAARADRAVGPAAAAGGGGHALRRATSLGWCPATGSARDAAAAPDPATAGCQCGAASGGTNAAIRAIRRRMRRPSTGPRA